MADPHPPSLPQPNPQPPPPPPPPPQPFPQPPSTPAKKSYSSIVQHPTASHFPHDPDRAAKESFHNEDLPQMGTATTHKGDPEPKPTLNHWTIKPQKLMIRPRWLTMTLPKKKGKKVMFTEDNQEKSTRPKDSRTETPSKELLRPNDKDVSSAIQGHQQVPPASVDISDEDNFNYDDPIIAELLDKDWDKELNKQGKSPSDKAAHFDLTSSKNGTSGGPNREPQPGQTSKDSRQLLFTPA
ncbi:hypothetical protein Salat_2066700 [Sesamum alatum]|uniref:Uncharacterized protein n=1 Tax=Sesamum alatum TaxID=300844 RepID=A0AAE1Y0A4_9LAMI|nr:hypothetical protein Salat_2066700 [Sesamum alatum]